MGKAKKHIKQKTGRPKINKHVDFVIYLNGVAGSEKAINDIKNRCEDIFMEKVIKIINLTSLKQSDKNKYISDNYADINEWIQHCEAVLYYSGDTNSTFSPDAFLFGMISIYNKPIINLSKVRTINNAYLQDINDEANKFKIGNIQYEIEKKFLISEELYHKYVDSDYVVNNAERSDYDIVQFYDGDDVRYRELIPLNKKGEPIEDTEPIYVKEIKSSLDLDLETRGTYPGISAKSEVSMNIPLRQYIVKFKEFKRWHDYERPIRKRRTVFSFKTKFGRPVNIVFDKVKISTHTLYMCEVETIVDFSRKYPDNLTEDIFNIDKAVGYINDFNPCDISLSNGIDMSEVTPDDGINNKRIMNFIMEHKDQENYLKFIDFMKYCNSKCHNSVIKTKKSIYNEPNKQPEKIKRRN